MRIRGYSGLVIGPEDPGWPRALRAQRALYLVTTLALAAIMGAAVVGALTDVDTFGVDSRRARASGGGYELEVHYATRSRGGLATPFAVTVERDGGFDGPLTIGVHAHYLAMWDENGLYPSPSGESMSGDWVLWEFDAPEGEVFRFVYDARIEPAVQSGRSGRVAVFEGDRPVVEVDLRTQVLP
jgi:hypothetical protein